MARSPKGLISNESADPAADYFRFEPTGRPGEYEIMGPDPRRQIERLLTLWEQRAREHIEQYVPRRAVGPVTLPNGCAVTFIVEAEHSAARQILDRITIARSYLRDFDRSGESGYLVEAFYQLLVCLSENEPAISAPIEQKPRRSLGGRTAAKNKQQGAEGKEGTRKRNARMTDEFLRRWKPGKGKSATALMREIGQGEGFAKKSQHPIKIISEGLKTRGVPRR